MKNILKIFLLLLLVVPGYCFAEDDPLEVATAAYVDTKIVKASGGLVTINPSADGAGVTVSTSGSVNVPSALTVGVGEDAKAVATVDQLSVVRSGQNGATFVNMWVE